MVNSTRGGTISVRNATPINRIINQIEPLEAIELNHKSCYANYQLPKFKRSAFLGIYPPWHCSCDGHRDLQPAFYHPARTVNIEYSDPPA